MEEKELEIVEKSLQAFMQYGIRSMTMDDLSRHMGISKKTLYRYVSDKDDLVSKCLMRQTKTEADMMKSICAKGLNAIDEMYEIGRFISGILKAMHPSIHYDLEKYHKAAFDKTLKAHQQNIYACMKSNLDKGIREGLYREELNTDVISKLYMSKIDVVFDPKVFPPEEISFEEVYASLFRYHILGIASNKGRDYLKSKLKKVKPTAL